MNITCERVYDTLNYNSHDTKIDFVIILKNEFILKLFSIQTLWKVPIKSECSSERLTVIG